MKSGAPEGRLGLHLVAHEGVDRGDLGEQAELARHQMRVAGRLAAMGERLEGELGLEPLETPEAG